jgi:deoxyinosine 3'endonuclease (endonuclease V)
VGVESGIPTIGVFKNFLSITPRLSRKTVMAQAQLQCPNLKDVMILEEDIDGCRVKCGVLRTTDSVPFRPIFVSPGNMIDFTSAVEIVKTVCKFREPEPLRLADRISRAFLKEKG